MEKQTRNSQQRSLILELLKDNYDHPTADEIYEMAREEDPRISRGTVYRNLKVLSEMGKIHKVSMISGPDHYDSNVRPHYHFLCRCCRKVFDAPIPYHRSLNRTPSEMEGFRTEWHRLLLIGLCPECAEKEDKKA